MWFVKSINNIKMDRLTQVQLWAEKNVMCELCRYRDRWEDMIETIKDGKAIIAHKECIEDKIGSRYDTYNEETGEAQI